MPLKTDHSDESDDLTGVELYKVLLVVLRCTNVFVRTTVALWKMLPRLAWLTLRLSLMCFADTILLVREVDSLLWFCP